MEALLDNNAGSVALRKGSFYSRFAELVSRPRAAYGIAALAVVLSLPALSIGLTADDFDLGMEVQRDPLSAYAFHSRDPVLGKAAILEARAAGKAPWWIDPEQHVAFLRPLSSLSLALDFSLFPSAPWLMHLENSILFALIVLLAASLYKALGLSERTRGIATFFFAMQGAQSMTIGWIAGRNTLLAALFGLLAMRLFVAAHSSKRMPLAALAAFVLALLSGEGGVAAGAYMCSYALFAGPVSVKRMLSAIWPFAVVVLIWLIAYKTLGYGAKNSGFYVDASQTPLLWLVDLITAVPIYLASQLTFPFASTASLHPLARPIVTVISLAILFVSRSLWLPWLERDSRARTFGLGALLAILPLGSSIPQDRLVTFIALGICGLLALIVEERLSKPCELPERGATRLFRYHAIWAPVLFVPMLFGASQPMVAGGGASVLDKVLGSDVRPVLLVNAPGYLPVHFYARKRQWFDKPYAPIEVMYAGAAELELTRSAEQSLELAVHGGYFGSRVERIERDPRVHPLQVGDVIQTNRMRAEVIEVKDAVPTRVRFDFEESLNDARVYAWYGHDLEPLALPQVGQRVQIRGAGAL